MSFQIWVDADSLPKTLRTIVLKAAVRLCAAAYFVADRELTDVKQFIAEDTHRIRTEKSDRTLRSEISMVVVSTGENSADNYIADNANCYSLCITHDIPLAARLLEKGCFVIDDRGGEYTADNIRAKLGDRAVNAELRTWGVFSEQQKKQKPSDVKAFAEKFDAVSFKLSRLTSGKKTPSEK